MLDDAEDELPADESEDDDEELEELSLLADELVVLLDFEESRLSVR